MLIGIDFLVGDPSELDLPEQQAAHLAVLGRYYGWLSYKLAQSCHWGVQKRCGTCFLCSIVCLLPFLPTPSILKAKIGVGGYNVVTFCVGAQPDRGAKEQTYGMLRHDVCNTPKSDTSSMTKEPCDRCAEGAGGKNGQNEKGFPEL